MTPRRILLINAHPDPSAERLCAGLTQAYEDAAKTAGHAVDRVDLGGLDFDFLTRADDFKTPPPRLFDPVRESLAAADHLVLVYPLWLGTMPAKLKAWLEQIARAGFFLDLSGGARWPAQKMKGKSARVVVTMGMPGFAYRLFYRSHSLKALEVGILKISGFKPVRDTVFGSVEAGPEHRRRMLDAMADLGRRGA